MSAESCVMGSSAEFKCILQERIQKVTVTSGILGPTVTPALAQGKTECGHPCILSLRTHSS
jgi:hypothetical protein